jgi:hypothetical protein
MGRFSNRARTVTSVVLAVLSAVLVLVGTVAFYARTEVVDEHAFADRAVTALRDDEVRRVVGREIVVNLIDRGSNDLIAARPLLETVVDAGLQTDVFRRVFREAAIQTNRVLFVRDKSNVAFDLADASEIVRYGLRSVDPKLAKQVPRNVDVALLQLKRRQFATGTLEVADRVRVLGLVLPALALVALLGAVAVAPDRRLGVLRAGVAVGAAGAMLAIVLLILRWRILAGVVGEDEVTDAEVRGAVRGILDAFAGDLIGWGLGLAFGGLVVAAAAAALDRESVEQPAERLRRRLLARPQTPARRALRGALVLALGIFVALTPTLSLQIGAVLTGAYLAFVGTCELLTGLQRRGVARERAERGRRRALALSAGVAALGVAAAAAAVLVLTSGSPPRPAEASASPPGGCNGSRAMCGLRLNEAVFAGTHNSFSAADSPGWFIANQRHAIARQLDDGIRLLLIDPHWGVGAGDGHVRTDFKAEGRDRNRVAKALPPETLAAAERLAGRLGLGDLEGSEREVYLCHTACELGATRMVDALDDVREFLDRNPGEVVILFVEPYVPPSAIADVFEEAGLSDQLVTLDRDAPLPTLGELVASDHRVVVFTERDADGSLPWYMDGFSFVQDTPLGAKTVDELSCDRNRGSADSPFLMLNQWADVFPPRAGANPPFQTREELLHRAHQCARQRGLPADLIAVDHYDQGDLIPAVAELNRERIKAAERSTGR